MRQYTQILTRRDGLIAKVESYIADFDALLCPVTMGPAFPHCPSGSPIEIYGHAVPTAGFLITCTPSRRTGS